MFSPRWIGLVCIGALSVGCRTYQEEWIVEVSPPIVAVQPAPQYSTPTVPLPPAVIREERTRQELLPPPAELKAPVPRQLPPAAAEPMPQAPEIPHLRAQLGKRAIPDGETWIPVK